SASRAVAGGAARRPGAARRRRGHHRRSAVSSAQPEEDARARDRPDPPRGNPPRVRHHRPPPPAGAPPAVPPPPPPRPDGLPNRGPASVGSAVDAPERPPLDVARRIVELAEDKKAADIVLLDLAGLTTLADAFVICSGGSERQLDAIADGVIEGMR